MPLTRLELIIVPKRSLKTLGGSIDIIMKAQKQKAPWDVELLVQNHSVHHAAHKGNTSLESETIEAL